MTNADMIRRLEKLTDDKIRELAVKSVHENADVVISDAIVANAEGLTFAGNKIAEFAPFSDWEESGDFHRHLKFRDEKDIEFTSNGDGAESIFQVFPEYDTIAPTAKILDSSTLSELQQSLVNNIENEIK